MPRDLALRIGELLSAFLLLDVVEIAQAGERSPAEIAQLHFAVSDRFSVDEMLTKITELPRDDRWSTLARAALRHDLYAALSTITSAVLTSTTASCRRRSGSSGGSAPTRREWPARGQPSPRRWPATQSIWPRSRWRCA